MPLNPTHAAIPARAKPSNVRWRVNGMPNSTPGATRDRRRCCSRSVSETPTRNAALVHTWFPHSGLVDARRSGPIAGSHQVGDFLRMTKVVPLVTVPEGTDPAEFLARLLAVDPDDDGDDRSEEES